MIALFAILLLLAGVGLQACGPVDPPGFDPAFAKIQPILAQDCGTCHNGSEVFAFTSAAQFKASKALDELTTGGMPPPPNKISDSDKAALLDYLK